MDLAALRAAYDEQVRRSTWCGPGETVEVTARLVRVLGPAWTGVTWSDLDASSADAVIAGEIARFAGSSWEWKHFSYDQPGDLAQRLVAAGFVPGEPEAVLVAPVKERAVEALPPAGIEIVEVQDAGGVEAIVRVHDEVFGADHSGTGTALLAALRDPRPGQVGVLALAAGTPVAAGRVELPEGSQFAGLWGGGTLPEWRHRGVFRALVARRARLAADRGFRYLHVDASADSRPILQRLGFEQIAVTTPFAGPMGTGRPRDADGTGQAPGGTSG